MMRRQAAALVLAFTATWLAPAAGEMPYPSNPQPCTETNTDPPCIEPTAFAQYLFLPATTPLTLPNDFAGGDAWKLTSATTGNPAIDTSAQELFGVTGASVDRAWQTTTGRPDVLIAVLDSGIRWAEPQPDLVNKFYLNAGELPGQGAPTRATYDRNGDGLFNIADYLANGTDVQDSRVSDQNGNGVIDPEDLIFIFSNGVDDDGNGYVDDISGWDFFEDDNDPLDEVRYGHGTGESHDSAAEANNGGDEVGTCPNCCCRCASATASSPTPTPSRRASCSPATAAPTSCRRRWERSTTPPSASRPSTTPTTTASSSSPRPPTRSRRITTIPPTTTTPWR
jgi:hypothetical protein